MSKPAPPLESMKSIGWTYWQALIKGIAPPDMHPAFAPIGYFRLDDARKKKSWPVAVWEDGAGTKMARVGQAETVVFATPADEEDFSFKTMSRIRQAISYEAYLYWMEHRDWPPLEGAAAAVEASLKPIEEPGMGHNSGDLHAFETFEDQATAALAGLVAAKTVESAEAVAAAQSLRSRLTEIASEGDKAREIEKKPHLDAGRAVDERWNPRIKELRKSASDLRAAIEGFKTREANERRKEAERRAAEANPVIPASEPEKVQGGYGKTSTVRMVLVPTIVDFDKVYERMKNVPDVKYAVEAALKKVVEKVYANMAPGMPDLDGVTSVEQAKIR